MPGPGATVHPWQPRFVQAITGALCLEALLFAEPIAVYAALALLAAAALLPRLSPVDALFRLVVPARGARVPVAQAREAHQVMLLALGAGAALMLLGAEVTGWVFVGLVAGMALLTAVSGTRVDDRLRRALRARRGS